MPCKPSTNPADQFAARMGQLIGEAVDHNDVAELATLNHQALGAYYATGDDRFRQLANYAAECAVRGPARAAATRH